MVNLSLISNKAPKLFSAICSERNTISNTKSNTTENTWGSYKSGFSLKTVTINWKKIL